MHVVVQNIFFSFGGCNQLLPENFKGRVVSGLNSNKTKIRYSVAKTIVGIVCVFAIFSCNASADQTNASAVRANTAGDSGEISNSKTDDLKSAPYDRSDAAGRFVDLDPEQTGITLVNQWKPEPIHSSLLFGVYGTGVAIGDFDNDGLQDVFVAQQPEAGRLYRNLGNMKFEDVTKAVGIDPAGMWCTGTTFVDINNDGQLDLYLCGFHCPNRLYINEGGKFSEKAKEYLSLIHI